MSEPLLVAISTIAGGVFIYAFGHLLVVLFVDPIHRLRSIIGEIADSLIFYASMFSNPGQLPTEKIDEASETLRRQSAQLRSRANSIPWYGLWAILKLVREDTKIKEAAKELMGLSNTVYGLPHFNREKYAKLGRTNDRMRLKIEELLGIRSSKKKQKKGVGEGKWVYPLDRYAMGQATLFLLFATILFGLQGNTYEIYLFRIIGIMALVTTFVFTIALSRKTCESKVKLFLESKGKHGWKARIGTLVSGVYWGLYPLAFFTVFITHFLRGISDFSHEGILVQAVFILGFSLFIIIAIILFYSLKDVIFMKRK